MWVDYDVRIEKLSNINRKEHLKMSKLKNTNTVLKEMQNLVNEKGLRIVFTNNLIKINFDNFIIRF